MAKEHFVREYSYSRKYKFVFIWLSQIFLVLLTLSVVYWDFLWLVAVNFIAYAFNYYLLANSFNKKIFVHSEGKFVYRNVFRRRMSFNVDDIESIRRTKIRRGLVLKLKEGKGFVYLTPFWSNSLYLFRFILNRVAPERVEQREKIEELLS
ncbi:MAG: hypothetical protein KDC92_08940 [Bacteroidetes bacterium]|nr:hypothetical protein [Bacteroidota bacterium]